LDDPGARSADRDEQAENGACDRRCGKPRRSSDAMRLFRSYLYALWLYGALTFLGFALLPNAMITGPRGVALATRVWRRLAFGGLKWIVGAGVVIGGRENLPAGPALYAAKHQAMLDVLVPSLFLENAAYVYKIELQNELMLGWYLR